MRDRKFLKLGEKPLKMACRSIDKIAQPLFESFDLTFFSYKLSQGDKFIFLTNNYPWLKNCIDKDYATYLSSFQPEHEIIIWDALPKDNPVMVVYNDAKENFNIAHGVTIIKSSVAKEEHFNFATTRDHYEMNNFYFQHQEILERFILYFRDKAKKIIDAALTHALSLHELGLIKSALVQQEFYREIDYFIENTQIKAIQIDVEGESIDLNYTLAHTGYYLLQGLSTKEIARACYVSVKAVEARLAKLRKITATKNKKELVEFLNKGDVRKALDLALQKKSRHVHSKLGWMSRLLS
ncbi:helix-turn-helix transcriptional regulator [Legionella donaldsonii]|uniref:helix-turn-helix transcriptional regulator n=1 Tax=Legionella donaldsonii TaxID=45060 RepID=UPI00399D0454